MDCIKLVYKYIMRSDIWNPSLDIASKIIENYKSGISARKLGFEYKVADVTITDFLKRNNILIRNRSNAKRTNQINEDVFDEINEESAYWIGFILADGNIYYPKKRSKQLNFGLKESDWEHLEKFKKFIRSNKPLYYNNKAVFLSIYSDKIVNKLEEFGITKNKSKTAKVPEKLKDNRHFWRGVIDGDGWISLNSDPARSRIGLCGTLDVLNYFIKFSETANIINIKQDNFGEINLNSVKGSLFTKKLYDKCAIYLNRKYDLAIKFCGLFNLCINRSIESINMESNAIRQEN